MRFALLGSLVIADSSGDQVVLGGPRLRSLLAALLLRADIPVPVGELAEMVWDGSPPSGAVSTLRSYIRRLRRALGDDATRIIALGPGYLIRAERPEVDVLEFQSLCRDARAALRAGEWADGSAAAVQALGLWRAVPLLDVPSIALRTKFVPALERLRLQVLEDRFDAGLRLGHDRELVPQLLEMTTQHPLQERFHAQLMLALARTGQQAQALRAYREARRKLVDGFAIEPGPELRDMHRRILAGDVVAAAEKADRVLPCKHQGANVTSTLADVGDSLATETPPGTSAQPAGLITPRPAQLPSDIADFTGRAAQADHLHDALTRSAAADGLGTARVVVIAGAGGLGKTTLAVHAAHQARRFFPDGQLYVNLSAASDQPTVPGEVLAMFLRDLGVDGDKIPVSFGERATMYRTQLASRRMLILLDDAKDAAQVRPLLPGSASCAVLVTTRSRTPNLVSTGLVDLGTLLDPEALELFSRITGDARPAAEPEATAEILRACAGLPLAVRICAARLATRPQWRVATMADRLRDEQRRLDELQTGDLEVRASFRVSYDSLHIARHRSDPARVFRLLGLWRGRRISLAAAAALAGEREEELSGALEALVDANLLESPEPDRYELHDLLRLFAAERAQAEETQEERLGAVTRLLGWYLATTKAAADLLSPHRYRVPDDEPPESAPPPGSAQDAMAWYDDEHANLLAAVRQAAAAGLHQVAWRLPTALFELFGRRHDWVDCIAAHRTAVDSARLAGSSLGEAWALCNLGWGLASVGDAEAISRIEEASAIHRDAKDPGGQAQASIALADAHYKVHGARAAYGHSLRSLGLVREKGSPGSLSAALNNHAVYCRDLGKMDEATEHLLEALAIVRATGVGHGHGYVLENLGRVQLKSGRFGEAVLSLSEAHRRQLAQGNLIGQAHALRYLGEAQHGAGRSDQARESLRAALTLYEDLNATAEAEDTRSALAVLPEPTYPAAR